MKITGIYFCGKAGVGKSYSAAYVQKKYGLVTAKFAYPVYMLAEKYFNMTTKDRHLLQYIGTDVGRTLIDPNIWVNRFVEDIKIVSKTAKDLGRSVQFVSDDVRFSNEHHALRNMGWLGFHLYAPEEIRIQRLGARDGSAQTNTLNHASETALDEFAGSLIQIDASGSLENMYEQIDEFVQPYIKLQE